MEQFGYKNIEKAADSEDVEYNSIKTQDIQQLIQS